MGHLVSRLFIYIYYIYECIGMISIFAQKLNPLGTGEGTDQILNTLILHTLTHIVANQVEPLAEPNLYS